MKYLLKEVVNNVFAIIVPDRYDLAMLFCRVQEFYESPNKKFRNKKFSIWEYFEWYSKSKYGCFSYPKDWSGFNLPVCVALNCYKKNKIETPYDELFNKILNKIKSKNAYIIGIDKIGTKVYQHELCHGLYYTNEDYRKDMDNITNYLSKKDKVKLRKNLIDKGYCDSVIYDEIQAYIATESDSFLVKGLRNKLKIHRSYRKIFEKYK